MVILLVGISIGLLAILLYVLALSRNHTHKWHITEMGPVDKMDGWYADYHYSLKCDKCGEEKDVTRRALI